VPGRISGGIAEQPRARAVGNHTRRRVAQDLATPPGAEGVGASRESLDRCRLAQRECQRAASRWRISFRRAAPGSRAPRLAPPGGPTRWQNPPARAPLPRGR